jgi:predicted nucleic-acid-binding Zn-ribbon protein
MSAFGLGKKEEPETVEINGINLVCQVCGHDKFWRTQAQLNTSLATFFKLDWTNISADCLICDNCGYIHWFLPNSAQNRTR